MWEKILMPLAGALLFFLMSGGFMLGVNGASKRMRMILRSSVCFVAAMLFSMAWHRELARVLGWTDAWIATTIIGAIVSILLARHWFAKGNESDSDPVG